jgi:hypothetical protein
MKTKKWAIVFLLFTGIILFAVQPVLGGCEVSYLDALVSDDNAPGTKLEGPITVFYQKTSDDPAGPEFTADMYFFLRLRKGSEFYSFASGPYHDIIVPTDYLGVVKDSLELYFVSTVVPTVFPGCDTAPEGCPGIVLKSYDMDVDDEIPFDDNGNPLGDNGNLFYVIANIVVGIHY